MMNCIEDRIMEMVALGVQDKESSNNVLAHLKECHFCSASYNQYVDYYQSVRDDFKEIPEAAVNDLVNSISPGSQHQTLRLISWSEGASQQGENKATLAADLPEASESIKYENMAVLSNSNGDILARLIKDRAQGTSALHIIATDPDQYQEVLVTLNPGNQQFITDEFGHIALGDFEIVDHLDLKVEVTTPTAVFDLTNLDSDWDELVGKGSIPIKNTDHDHIEIEFQPAGEGYSLKVKLEKISDHRGAEKLQIVAIKGSKEKWLANVKSGVAIVKNINAQSGIQVKVFG